MLEGQLGGEAFSGSHHDELADEVLGLLADVRPGVLGELELGGPHGSHVLLVPGHHPGEHEVH
jgi:hypothetical protein